MTITIKKRQLKYYLYSALFLLTVAGISFPLLSNSGKIGNEDLTPREEAFKQAFASDPFDVQKCIDLCPQIGTVNDLPCTDLCWSNEANYKKDFTICQKNITDEIVFSTCAISFASLNEDISICDLITDRNYAYACITTVATTLNNVDLCEFIPDETLMNTCIQTVQNNQPGESVE